MPSVRHRGVVGRLRQAWRTFALSVRRVVMLEDDPVRIARGCAAGMFTAFLPMLGQTFAGMLLAWLIRGSPLAAMPWSWLTNPLTTLPVWYGCYRVGAALIPGHETMGWDRLGELVDTVQGMGLVDGTLHGAQVLGGVFLPMLLGSVLVGAAAAVPTYLVVRRAVRALQARRAARAAHWKSRLVPAAGGGTT